MNHFNLPNLGYGMGLRTTHYNEIIDIWPEIDWFEIISENFMDTGGRPRRMLDKIKAHYPIVMHGVSLSIGTVDPLNSEYLAKLKALIDDTNPAWVSDHLCWTGVAHKNLHDLLPVPYTQEALSHITNRIKQVQDIIERPLLLENPSTYLEFTDSTMPESEFIAQMAEEANCGLLLDVNNIYVTCYNHRLDPKEYIDNLPLNRVIQIHLAGHTNKGTHIIDTHEGEVIDEVWEIYKYVISQKGSQCATMVEWDTEIPDFATVKSEVEKARIAANSILNVDNPDINLPDLAAKRDEYKPSDDRLERQYSKLQNSILKGVGSDEDPDNWIIAKQDFPPEAQLQVYYNGYRYRLFDIIHGVYEGLRAYLGDEEMNKIIWEYLEEHISNSFNISRYNLAFPEFVRKNADHFAYEIALLETELDQLFDAEETDVLTREDMAEMNPEDLLDMQFIPRKALKMMEFSYPVNQYYRDVMNICNGENPANDNHGDGNAIPQGEQGDNEGKDKTSNAAGSNLELTETLLPVEAYNVPVPLAQKSFLVVYRHEDRMWRLPLSEEEYIFFNRLLDGKTLGEAIEIMMDNQNDDADEEEIISNTQLYFTRWMSHGLFAMIKNNDAVAIDVAKIAT